MKKNVFVFGSIAGLIVSVLMLWSIAACYQNADFEGSMLLGYASMLLAFSFVFVGVKNYRDKYNDGVISFGKAFKVGLFITLIASTCYVVAWLIAYYLFIPDFMDKYTAHVLKMAEKGGATAAQMQQQVKDMEGYKEMYRNPVWVILLTYTEILPVGLIVTLISAGILKRKVAKPGDRVLA